MTSGTKSATLHIASNDSDENPFDIVLTGRGLSPSADEDGDGIPNATELALAPLGFDAFVDSSALHALLRANAPGLGLTNGIKEEFLALGSPVIEKNPLTGKFHLSINLQKSANLISWSPLLNFTPTFDPISGRIDIEVIPSGPTTEFLRVFGGKP